MLIAISASSFPWSIHSQNVRAYKTRAYKTVLQKHNLFGGGETRDDHGTLVIRPLKHFATGELAESRLCQDMMSFRDIGLAAYRNCG